MPLSKEGYTVPEPFYKHNDDDDTNITSPTSHIRGEADLSRQTAKDYKKKGMTREAEVFDDAADELDRSANEIDEIHRNRRDR